MEFTEFSDWEDFLIVFRDVHKDDNLWIVMSRHNGISFNPSMNRIPGYLNKYFQQNSFILVYPLHDACHYDINLLYIPAFSA